MGVRQEYESVWTGYAPLASPSTAAISVATRIRFDVAGRIVAMKYWRDTVDTGNHVGYLRKIGPGVVTRAVAFPKHAAGSSDPSGWETAYINPMQVVAAGDIWQLCMIFATGHAGQTIGPHSTDHDLTIGHFTVLADAAGAPNGSETGSSTLNPPNSSGAAKWAVDVNFLPD
jgi:hypothetical protein